MKILLVCAAGMSTSLVVEKMKKALDPTEQHFVIIAEYVDKFAEVVQNFDVVMLAPQVRFKLAEFKKEAAIYGIPVELINAMDYGLCRGDKILTAAKELNANKALQISKGE